MNLIQQGQRIGVNGKIIALKYGEETSGSTVAVSLSIYKLLKKEPEPLKKLFKLSVRVMYILP
jgi:ribosomal protein L25 (general stress protein Ctc)